MAELVFHGPGEGRQIISGQMALAGRMPNADLMIKASASETGAAYSVFESVVPAGAPGPQPHIHSTAEEAWYIVEGSLKFNIGNKEFIAEAGSFILAPRGTVHSFSNPSDRVAKHLVIFSPPRDELWRTVSEIREDAGDLPLELEKIVALYEKHGEDIRNLGITR